MKYETPEMTTLTRAINAIQSQGSNKIGPLNQMDGQFENESVGTYVDWEN